MKNTHNFYHNIFKTLLLGCGFSLLLISCENTIDDDETENIQDIAVVASFLDPDREITVKLSKMIPFIDEEFTDNLSIENAEVYITHNGNEYLLTEDTEEPGIYLNTNPELTLVANDSYDIHFLYNETTVSATTIIPSEPENASLSAPTIEIEEFVPGPPTGGDTQTVTAFWDNTNNEYHTILIEYLEDDYDPINSFIDPDTYDGLRVTSTDPISGDSVDLNSRNFSFYGTYRIAIYRVNSEYVNLFENISQNSLNLTEPLTNIDNGLGIFTGMNSTSLTLEVVPLN